MLTVIENRGPDELSFFSHENTLMGTARLKIIDLQSGQQPFIDPDSGHALVYNGEVYNYIELREELEALGHHFKTTSDTEVVLKSYLQWGKESFKRFNGGFALAIYNKHTKETIFARDFFGKRPLYYKQWGQSLVFGSEIKCLMAYSPDWFQFSPSQLFDNAQFWSESPAESVYQNIKQIPPGHFMSFKNGELSTTAYQKSYSPPHEENIDEEEALEEVDRLIRKAVSIRLRSDVELGVYLSGGIDSSLITHYMATEMGKSFQSFSVNFNDQSFDESQYQELMAKEFGAIHHSCQFSEDDFLKTLSEGLWHAEKPCFRLAFLPMLKLSQLAKEKGVKVVLSGEGADEIFLGYNIFKELLIRENWEQIPENEKSGELKNLYPYLSQFSEQNLRFTKSLFSKFSKNQQDSFFGHQLRINSNQLTTRLIKTDLATENYQTQLQQVHNFLELDSLRKTQIVENWSLLSGYLLSTQGDRMSFASSIEQRCPFLDKEVFNFTWKLPRKLMLTKKNKVWQEKNLLKGLATRFLPELISQRPKTPYRSPDHRIVKSSTFHSLLQDLLSSQNTQGLNFLDQKHITGLLRSIDRKETHQLKPAETHSAIFLISLLSLNNDFKTKLSAASTKAQSLEIKAIAL